MSELINIAILHCDLEYAQGLLEILKPCGLELTVTIYTCPEEALKEFKINPPDVLVMEEGNSKIDGIDMCLVLREEPELVELPIVLVSGGSQLKDLTLYFKGVDIITKPIDGNKLLSKIKLYHSLIQIKSALLDISKRMDGHEDS